MLMLFLGTKKPPIGGHIFKLVTGNLVYGTHYAKLVTGNLGVVQ
jgi:hypothetical protein